MTPTAGPPLGAYAGATVGVCGWVLGLVVACLATGEYGLLLTLALPGLLLSLGLSALLIAFLERRRRRGVAAARYGAAVAGGCLLLLAALGAVLRLWVMPRLLQSERLREFLATTQSAVSIPWAVVAACAAAGTLLLLLPHRATGAR